MVSWLRKSPVFMLQVPCCVHNSLQVDPALRQITLVQILMALFSKIHFNTIEHIQLKSSQRSRMNAGETKSRIKDERR